MKLKETLHDVFDIDRSLTKTFIALFVNPKEVIDNPGHYMKPWHYATYVVTISSLLFWTVIHFLGDPTEYHILWALPERVLSLTNGYVQFYENTQPLKRLLLGSLALYAGFQMALYGERKSMFRIALYLTGQSVFIVFIVQALRMIILGGGVLNSGDSLTGIITHVLYLTYAALNIFHQRWWLFALKVIFVTVVYYGLYSISSSLGIHYIYYHVLHWDSNFYNPQPDRVNIEKLLIDFPSGGPRNRSSFTNEDSSRPLISPSAELFTDSLTIVRQCQTPRGEVSQVTIAARAKGHRELKWTTTIFQKEDRYSPDSTGIFLRWDSIHQAVVACYRISNNQNAILRVTSVDLNTGHIRFQKDIDLHADNMTLEDVAIDDTGIYLCGAASNLYGKFGLGMLARLHPQTGDLLSSRLVGEASFNSFTSFRQLNLNKDKVILTTSRGYKRLMYFPTQEWSTIALNKKELLRKGN